jgi:putative ABC transport system ATP-binding protein
LVISPSIVLADEPTANLDHKTGEEILVLMQKINRALKTTFIFSTHDKRVIAKADRLVRVEDGEVTMLGVRSNNNWSFARHRPLGLSVASTSHHIGRPLKVSAAIGESSNAERN